MVIFSAAAAAVVSAVPYQEESYRGHGLFGEAGLNAVPRIGKRVARHSNPYDAFRFRFNDGPNWFGRGLAGGNAGFRFDGTDTGLRRTYQLRKRMAKAIGLDRDELAQAEMEKMQKMAAAMAGGKNGLQATSVAGDEDNTEEDDLLTADEYWREYLDEMARKNIIEKLIQPLVKPPHKSSSMVARHRTPSMSSALPSSIGSGARMSPLLQMFNQPQGPRD